MHDVGIAVQVDVVLVAAARLARGRVADVDVQPVDLPPQQLGPAIQRRRHVAETAGREERHLLGRFFERVDYQPHSALELLRLIDAAVVRRTERLGQTDRPGNLAAGQVQHLADGNLAGRLDLVLAAVQDDAADVELRQRKQRGQVEMVVRVHVRMVQVRAVENRNLLGRGANGRP